MNKLLVIFALSATFLLNGCGNDDDDDGRGVYYYPNGYYDPRGGGPYFGIRQSTSSAPGGQVSAAVSGTAPTSVARLDARVVQVTLHRSDGAAVGLLTAPATVDLAGNGLADLIAATSVPAGSYDRASVDLDLASARVDLVSGKSTTTGSVALHDAAGKPLAQLAVTAALPPEAPFLVLPQQPAHLGIELDLTASVLSEEPASPAIVTLVPAASAHDGREKPLRARIRGVARSADAKAIEIDLEATSTAKPHTLTVTPAAEAIFSGNDIDHDGKTSLEDLAPPSGSVDIEAAGTFDPAPGRFVVDQIEVGTFVPEAPKVD